MTSIPVKPEAPKFLPSLQLDKSVPLPAGGHSDWTAHGGGLVTLAKYAATLKIDVRGIRPESLKSVPTPWARLLLFEQALFEAQHPVHSYVVDEWRGLLGALALSEYLKLGVKAIPLDLSTAKGSGADLRGMASAGPEWDRFALIKFGGVLVGGTSPRTLVFTGIRPTHVTKVPFQDNGRLIDPVRYYVSIGSLRPIAYLGRWLDHAIDLLKRNNSGGIRSYLAEAGQTDAPRTSKILELLSAWQSAIHAAPSVALVAEPRGFGSSSLAPAVSEVPGAREVFAALGPVLPSTVAEEEQECDLRLAEGLAAVEPGQKGVIYLEGQPYAGPVALPNGQSRQARAGRLTSAISASDLGSVSIPSLDRFFEPRIIEVVDVNYDAANVLQVGSASFLYPFKEEILKHLPPEILRSSVEMFGERATGLTVVLDVKTQRGLSVRFEHRYESTQVEAAATPDLGIWPNFVAEGWNQYFYLVSRIDPTALVLRPVGQSESEDSSDRLVTWGKTAYMPKAWRATANGTGGLLLTKSAPPIEFDKQMWDIAIDFGSTHTRVFRAEKGPTGDAQTKTVQLTPRAVVLLGRETGLEFNFFNASDHGDAKLDEPASLVWLPQAKAVDTPDWRPSNGVMFWEPLLEVQNRATVPTHLRSHLKWHRSETDDLPAFHSYISQLYLCIAAEAAAVGARVRSVRTAFPSVFPRHLRHRHEQEWATLTRRYSVEVKPPLAESTAVAAYLSGTGQGQVMANLLAVDIGGSTSDLAVWSNGKMVAGDSIRLAGDILSRLLRNDRSSRDLVSKAAQRTPISIVLPEWQPDGSDINGLIFTSLLRATAKKTPTKHLAHNMYQGPGSPGARLLSYLAYAIATVSFTLGMLAKRENVTSDHFDIFFAGRGGELVDWLDVLYDRASQTLPATFFAAGYGEPSLAGQVRIGLPKHPKEEVGRGLLSAELDAPVGDQERVTFAGEAILGSKGASWADRLDGDAMRALPLPSQPIPLARFEKLRAFVTAFGNDSAAKEVARALGLQWLSLEADATLRNHIHTRLFGPGSAWSLYQRGAAADHALLEPFFVIEAKALLEHATNNANLFAE